MNTPESRALIRKAAIVYGKLLHQDAVTDHRPFDDALVRANGAELEAGHPLDENTTKALYQKVADLLQERYGVTPEKAFEIAPIPTSTGARFLKFDDNIPNKGFHAVIRDAAEQVLPHDAEAHVSVFRSDGDLASNNWQENPHGEGYDGSSPGGPSDVQGRLERELGPKIAAINAKYRAEAEGKAGAGEQPGAEGQTARLKSVAATKAPRPDLPDHTEAIHQHINAVTSGWKNAPEIHVHSSVADAPPLLRARLEDVAPGVQVEGAAWNNKVHLFADALRSKDHAESVLLHETVGHWGLSRAFGDKRPELLDSVHASVKDTPEYKALEDRYGDAYAALDPAEKTRAITEELLPDRAAIDKPPGLISRVTAWVRSWAALARHGSRVVRERHHQSDARRGPRCSPRAHLALRVGCTGHHIQRGQAGCDV